MSPSSSSSSILPDESYTFLFCTSFLEIVIITQRHCPSQVESICTSPEIFQQEIAGGSVKPGAENSKALPVGFYLCSIHLNSCCSQLWGAVEPFPALCTVCRPVLLQQTSHRLLKKQWASSREGKGACVMLF